MVRFFKITVINVLVGLILFCLLEVIFGYWFDKDNAIYKKK